MLIRPGRGLSPMQNSKTPVSLPNPLKSRSKPVLIGDSITIANAIIATDVKAHTADGWFTHYNAIMGGRFNFNVVNIIAIAGNTTSNQLSRINGGALDSLDFDVAFILCGTNDLGSRSPADTATTLGLIIDKMINDFNVPVVVMTIMHRDDGGAILDQKINDLNALILNFDTRGGMLKIANLNPSWNNGNDNPKTGATVDGLHPAAYGAYLMAKDIKAATLGSFGAAPAINYASPQNILQNGTLAGTGGNLSLNATGTLADNFTLSGGGGSGGRVASKNTDGSQRIDFALITTSSGVNMKLNQTLNSGFALGDTVYAAIDVEIDGLAQHIYQHYLQLSIHGTNRPAYWISRNMFRTFLIPQAFENNGERYTLITPDLPISSGTGLSLQLNYYIYGNGSHGNPAIGINIKGAGIFKR